MRGFYNKPVATLPALLLPGGYSYSFMVRVTNFLDVSTDALVSIEKVTASLPTVVIESGSSRSVDSSSVLRIKAQVKPSACGPSVSKFSFEWKWISVSPPGPLPLLDQETVSTPQLYIEKNTLIPGRTYVLGFYATPDGSNNSAGYSQVTLTAKAAPVLAVIDGGHRVVSVTDDIVLDGSRSIDFDLFSRSNFSYSWSCQVGGLPCFPTAAALFEKDVDTLRVPFSHLSPGSYDFQLTVIKDMRAHSTTATITVNRDAPTRVGVAPIIKAKLNADDKITLQSLSFEPADTVVSFEWSEISGPYVLYVSSTNRSRDVVRVRSALDAAMLVSSCQDATLTPTIDTVIITAATAMTGFATITLATQVSGSSVAPILVFTPLTFVPMEQGYKSDHMVLPSDLTEMVSSGQSLLFRVEVDAFSEFRRGRLVIEGGALSPQYVGVTVPATPGATSNWHHPYTTAPQTTSAAPGVGPFVSNSTAPKMTSLPYPDENSIYFAQIFSIANSGESDAAQLEIRYFMKPQLIFSSDPIPSIGLSPDEPSLQAAIYKFPASMNTPSLGFSVLLCRTQAPAFNASAIFVTALASQDPNVPTLISFRILQLPDLCFSGGCSSYEVDVCFSSTGDASVCSFLIVRSVSRATIAQ